MRFTEMAISGAWIIEPEPISDHRGFFARVLDAEEFTRRRMVVPAMQWSISWNERRGTLRGLHVQLPPHEEAKLVRCTRGAIWDVLVDLRTGRWQSVELSEDDRRMVYVPPGVAHGFQTLRDDVEVAYAISAPHDPASARTILWCDTGLAIRWPIDDPIISDKDRNAPEWQR